MRCIAFACLFCLGIALPAPGRAADPEQVEFARAILARINAASIADDREYCGTIGLSRDGTLISSTARRGWRNLCRPRRPRGAASILASFHTHAAFAVNADSELPSPQDVHTDMAAGTDGYLATPGGRMWFIDGTNGTVFQICGPGCLPSDPNYQAEVFGPILTFYTLAQLEARIAGY